MSARSDSCSTRCAAPRPPTSRRRCARSRRFGYEGVELFDLHGHEPARVAAWLAELGLVACGRHARLDVDRGATCRRSPPRPRRSAGSGSSSAGWLTGRARRRRRSRASPPPPRPSPRTASSSGTTTTTPRSSRASSSACPRTSSSSSTPAGPGMRVPTRSTLLGRAGRSLHVKDFRVRGEHSFCAVGDGAVGYDRIVPAAVARRRGVADRRAGRAGRLRARGRPPLARGGQRHARGGRVNVGVVGCGVISRAYAENASAFDSFELVACADLDAAAGERARQGERSRRRGRRRADRGSVDRRHPQPHAAARARRGHVAGARRRQARLHREAARHRRACGRGARARGRPAAGCASAARPTSSSALPTRQAARRSTRARSASRSR